MQAQRRLRNVYLLLGGGASSCSCQAKIQGFDTKARSRNSQSSLLLSNSLRPHGLQQARLPCPSLSPRICSNSCPLSQWCHLLLLLPSIFPNIRVFSNKLALRIRWPKYWSFSFSISPPNEYSELNFFRIDWFDLLAVWGLSRVFSNTTIRKHQLSSTQPSNMIQFSHPYMTTGKTIASTIWTFVGKVMSLLLNMLSSFVICFLPRSKRLWISGLQSLSALIFEPEKIKSVMVSAFSPSVCHEAMGLDAVIFVF